MAVAASERHPEHLRAVVDMGSNGIRFSISTLQPPTARIMPTLYQHRAGISLYDAQYSASGERQPIDQATISAVLSAFRQFRRTCVDFHVPDEYIKVLATEATRTAINSEDFRKQIKVAVGWDVTMLAKEEEGRIGALGVASSLPEVNGLVMDLGGGSTQLNWLMKKTGQYDEDHDEVLMPAGGAVSLPYGAAAVSRRLAEAKKSGSLTSFESEVKGAVRNAYRNLKVPEELSRLATASDGFTLYLSGGGFRGWGYVLMSQHPLQPYPIPVINGFKALREDFLETDLVKNAAAATLEDHSDMEADIFGISDRRASQVPAVAFLVKALSEALPQVKEVRFCQGGVREGYLFSSLPKEVTEQSPERVATEPFNSSGSSKRLAHLIQDALPNSGLHENSSFMLNKDLLNAFANMMYYHSSHSKDLQATSALRSTTSGILAGVHGMLHETRALLALLLCERWGGSVPPSDEPFKRDLETLIDVPDTRWWIKYVGAVAALVASVYPAGMHEGAYGRLGLRATWSRDDKERPVLSLACTFAADIDPIAFEKEVKGIEKVGKKKRWIIGIIGYKVSVQVSTRERW